MFFKVLVFLICLLGLLVCFWRSRAFRRRPPPSSSQHPSPTGSTLPRISKDSALIQPVYDIVIVGSGYGGGVAASRLARAGKRVCVLEKGAEVWPGQFPHTLKAALRQYGLKDMRTGRFGSLGKASGLYQMYKGKGQDVFTGCGLGGTSLINAGVFLRADERTLKGPEWPVEIRNEGLAQYYERSERMLQPTSYPESLPKPHKLHVFEQQAKSLGLGHRLYRPPLTVSFDDCTNSAGVTMRPSAGSGSECTGLNDGSKNSVLVTYLADAWTWGAEIFCGVDVSHIQRHEREDGYTVHFVLTNSHLTNQTMWIHAKELVVLGAGAVGTTELLLRSRSQGLHGSPLVGQRLSGNGDLLAFAYNCDRKIQAVGGEAYSTSYIERCGPTITACIDMRGPEEAHTAKDGFLIQEGVIPGVLGSVIQAMIEARIPVTRLYSSLDDAMARLKSWALGPYIAGGSVNRTAVYLVMSHDENEGTIEMSDGKLTLRWSGSDNQSRSDRIRNLLIRATAAVKGTFVTAPAITVHPLGGACMSSDNTGLGGVVNHMGQLFSGSDNMVHEGIVCVDASIIPRSLGVNPCATITAIAERSCDLLIRTRGWIVDERHNEQLNFQEPPFNTQALSPQVSTRRETYRLHERDGGLKFDEILQGFLHVTNADCSFETAFETAKVMASSAKAAMTVALYRTENWSYRGCATGTVSFSALSRDPLMIVQGHVDLFVTDETVSDAVKLVYNLDLLGIDGKEYSMHGHKAIDSRITLSPVRAWIATTTLFTTISLRDGTQVAKGMLLLSLGGFVSELISLRCNPGLGFRQRFCVKLRFLSFFARNLMSYVLSPFRALQYTASKQDHFGDWEKAKPSETRIRAADGIEFCMKIWEPSPLVPLKETPIVLIPGASVDHQAFSLSTIPVNTIDYLTLQGYRCYVPVLRFGIGAEAKSGWTVFEARLDVRAALEYIRAQENDRKVYAVVHCLGSIATATALLQGDIQADWLCGMTCSQVFTDLIYTTDNNFKARHQTLIRAYRTLAGDWFSCRSSTSVPWIQYTLDQLLRFYPTGGWEEICNSASCHRCDLPFGRCWSHTNLNRATHARLDQYFDGIHMNFLTHLSRMGATFPHHIRSNLPDFADLVTPDNMQRLAGLNICFLSGGDNAVWKPDATKKSFDMFRQMFPDGKYDRVVVQGYGHLDCWMGKDAHRDIYPRVAHHIRFCEQGPTLRRERQG